jgi:hypothetical protein
MKGDDSNINKIVGTSIKSPKKLMIAILHR